MRAIGAVVLLAALSGCASYTYVDANHVQHVVGFVDIAMPAAESKPGESLTAAVTTTTLGLSIHRRPDGNNGFTVGYDRETVVTFPNGACLNLDSGEACETKTSSADLKGASLR